MLVILLDVSEFYCIPSIAFTGKQSISLSFMPFQKVKCVYISLWLLVEQWALFSSFQDMKLSCDSAFLLNTDLNMWTIGPFPHVLSMLLKFTEEANLFTFTFITLYYHFSHSNKRLCFENILWGNRHLKQKQFLHCNFSHMYIYIYLYIRSLCYEQ